MTIKAVLFDLGGTLIKFDVEHPGEVFQRILLSLGISRTLEETKTAFSNAEKEAKDLKLLSSFGKIDCEEYWNQWDALVLKHLGIADNMELARFVQSKWSEFVNTQLFPEVKEVLTELQERGVKLGLISTAYEEEIRSMLEKVDLKESNFNVIVGVDTIRKAKPDPEVFKYAVNRLKTKLEEAIFVGDNAEADYKGAQNAGVKALLIDRTDMQPHSLSTIKNLMEIFSHL